MQEISNPMVSIPEKEMPKYIIYLLVFLFTLHITPGTYINSSFLEQFIGEDIVGYIYTIASAITLLSFILTRRVLSKIGNYKTFLLFLIIDFFSLFILSMSIIFNSGIWPYIFIVSYIAGFTSRSIAFLNLDIFLEHITKNNETGGVRGSYLTSSNIAFILGPLISGFLITSVLDAGKVYLLSWVILIPVIVMTIRFLSNFKDSKYKKSDMFNTAIKVFRNNDLRNIFASTFILRFFYSWMIIYTPIFLSQFIGFNLGEVTLIISIALVPFVLLQLPLGKIADEWLGEKEILTAGFIITGFATLFMAFSDTKSFIFWASLLFITRIGASMIEIMTETHLFKKIDDNSINILSLFRATRPIAYIISPIIASLLLIKLDINYLFLVLGTIIILGTYFGLAIKDTK